MLGVGGWDWAGFVRTGVRMCVGLHQQPPPVNPLHRGGGLGDFPAIRADR